MDDVDGFPVFFPGPVLNAEQRKRIGSYFQIRRKSGGGECGPLMEVQEKVYSLVFKARDAQQRVLQKQEHVLEFEGGTLVLTLRDNPGPNTSSQDATASPDKVTNPKQDLTSSQESNLLSNLPPSGEEYKLQCDPYLLRYLEECPNAKLELEKKLASMSCSAQFHPEEDKVLVRQLAQPGAVGEADNWKSKVDQLFGSYMSHYEIDSHKIKALLQSCSSHQSADEVKVYSEVGVAVLVGKCPQVKARLADLESLCVKQRKSCSGETETTVLRLGEAKLRLLWKEIKRSVGENFPGVKATRADEGKLLLEGSVEDILKASKLITKKKNLVLKRAVSDKTPHFLAFLKQVYGGPRMLCDILGVGDQVEVELRDTELLFFSLSANKLDELKKKLEEKLKEIKYDIPNCSAVPPELREKLKSKVNEMNKKECRAKVVFGDNTVCLLGHTEEVDELSEAISEFILDQSNIEGTVILPFPELVQHLPKLLQFHHFDYAGVTFSPLTASYRPSVVLNGSASKVTEVRNRLGLFLDSIVQDKVTVDMAGAMRYFDSHSGSQTLSQVADANKCLIHLEEQEHISGQNLGIVKYSLQHGLQVMVCEGDITKQYADALVNAANEDLNHTGGVAAALSGAGGPQVQKESKSIVKQTGKIPTGDVVVTTGGNLKCKKLLHAVGPVGGNSGGRDRILLEKTVQNVLNLAEMMEFKSVAMPCISSGVFGVPIRMCSDAIVTAIKKFGSQSGRCLNKIMLIDNRAEVVRAMQDACGRLLQEQGTRKSSQEDAEFQMNEGAAGGATARDDGDTVQVEIVQGTIETQQVDVIVSPMSSCNPLSTNIGKALVSVVGPQLTASFHKEATGVALPGETVVVDSLPGLKCKTVIFLNLDRWDNSQNGRPVQELRKGIQKILASCESNGFTSVAFPVLGTGALLLFPHKLASRLLLEEVREFELKRTIKTPFLVRIVVHPKDSDSSKALQSAQGALHLRGFTNDVNPDQASFYRHVSVTTDEVTALLGGVRLEMAFDDITTERTDVIVNTTNFLNQDSGVSKALLTAAGPSVQAELGKVGIPPGLMCTTGHGLLGCKEIVHADFKGDVQLIRKNCRKILMQCESKGFCSVAFPAINTGQKGLSPDEACKAMLDGMASAITDLKPKSLSLIRIVITQQIIFRAFKCELETRFGQIVQRSLKESALQKLKQLQGKCSRKFSTTSASQDESFLSSKPQPAVFRVTSCGQDIETIKTDLEGLLQKELLERTVSVHEFSKLSDMEMNAVMAKIQLSGISLENKRHQSPWVVNVGFGKPESDDEVYLLKGLKEDVLSVLELINKAVHKALEEDLRDKEEAMMALTVQWAMKDDCGEWRELTLRDNYTLENAHFTKQVSVDVEMPDAGKVKVNLKTLDATDWLTGKTYKLKRNESKTDLELPQHWEPMNGQDFKKVELLPSSNEYQKVANKFLNTAKRSIQKIERIQNVYLWHAFSVCRQRIIAKNGISEVGEKFLYHGTSAESCNCIERDRFDRSFAGTHAARYGKGVYFAVNANYSADHFSPADPSGLKRLYVARVLTGRYTVGTSSMKAPPPRGSDPTDCFNSLVDNQQQPSMFIIFHDDQAYPEYLITFR